MTVDLTRLVKPLEWEDFTTEHEARSMGLAWLAYETRDGEWNCVRCAPDNHRLATCVTIEVAQSAANADHAARVIAALDQDTLTALLAERDALKDRAEKAEAISKAAADVLAERQRQITAEGWTPKHDDTHDNGEMAKAASCYAAVATWRDCDRTDTMLNVRPPFWPWERSWWKPTTKRRDLVKAGALILAEIERLDRAALPEARGEN